MINNVMDKNLSGNSHINYHKSYLKNKKTLAFLQFSLIILYILLYSYVKVLFLNPITNIAYFFFLFQILWMLVSWKLVRGSLFNLYGFFIFAVAITHGSIPLLEILSIEQIFNSKYMNRLVDSLGNTDIWLGCCLASIFIGFFHLAALCAPRKTSFISKPNLDSEISSYRVGLVLLFIGVIAFFIYAKTILHYLNAFNYFAYSRAGAEAGGFAVNLSYLMVVGAFLIIGLSRKHLIWPFVLIVFVYIALFAIVGSRNKSLFTLFALFFLLNKRGIKINSNLIYAVALASVLIASSWSAYRLGGSIVELNNIGLVIQQSLSELGVYIYLIIVTVKNFADPEKITWGISYLNAVFHSLPLGQRVFYDDHAAGWWIAQEYFPEYIKEGNGFGTGFSFIAEAYQSLWWFGIIPMVIIGYFIAYLSNSESNNRLAVVFNASIMPFVLFYVRDSSPSLARGVLWYGIGPLIFYFYINKFPKKKKII